jgi:hypothetical protein
LARPGAWTALEVLTVNQRTPRLKATSGNLTRQFPDDRSAETFIGKRIKPNASGCWLYDGKTDTYGKTTLSRGGVTYHITVHRFVYETLIGPIPDDTELHHTCETPGCCNPAHLLPVTSSEHKSIHGELRRKRSPAA